MQLLALQYPCVPLSRSLSVVLPVSEKVGLPGLKVHSDTIVNQQLVFASSDVNNNPFLHPAHVLSHISIHLGRSDA